MEEAKKSLLQKKWEHQKWEHLDLLAHQLKSLKRLRPDIECMSNGTQLTRSLSIGHVVTTVGLVIDGFSFIYDLRESVAIQNFQLESVEDRLERVVARTDDQFGEIMDHLVRLEEKLDGIVLSGTPMQQKGN